MLQLLIDTNGKISIPPEAMMRHGLTPGSKLNFADTEERMILEPLAKPLKRKSMRGMAGFLGTDPKALNTLMEERRRDREMEDSPRGS